MERHLTENELRGYESRSMTASALVTADRHLAECAQCRYELRRAKAAPELPDLVREMPEPLHLTYEQMTGHIDAILTEAERAKVENHTAICRRCARELAGLKAFDAGMAPQREAALAAKPVAQSESWWTTARERFAQYFAVPHRLGFSAAGLALVIFGVFSLLQSAAPGAARGASSLAQVTAASLANHPHWFYGGFIVAACGIATLLYGLFKR